MGDNKSDATDTTPVGVTDSTVVEAAEEKTGTVQNGQTFAEVETVLNEKALVALTKHTLKFLAVLMAGIAFVFVFLGVMLLLSEYDKTVAIAVICAGAIVPFVMLVIIYLRLPKTVLKTQKNVLGTVQNVSFGDNIVFKETSPILKSNGIEIAWQYIVKADETQDYFFIFINKYSAYIIDKSAFIIGNADVLRAVFREKLGARFKTKFN